MNREEWLMAALEEVSKTGGAKLRIDKLVKSLGVTKGSFYWHFKDREDFVQSLLEFWAEFTNDKVIERAEQIGGDARERLWSVMQIIFTKGLGESELAMRAWAAEEPSVAIILREVEVQRMAYIGSLFAEMGFQGQDQEIRARLFNCYGSGELVSFYKQSPEDRQQTMKVVHALLTSPNNGGRA
jgi:AcrR family transcriptional regulator